LKNNQNPRVNTTCGGLFGNFEDDIFIFRGIPYAAPPSGNFRWMPPRPPMKWKGLRSALTPGHIAPQNPTKFKMNSEFVIDEPQSEDCLYLNIWSPGLDDQKRPVMVWIHGGAFTMGSGSKAQYSGCTLAKRGGVVVVTLNYRLGVFGFLNLNEITRGEIPSTGNEGLLDMIAALEWIRENIAAFGGNPENVTLFGESAGAMSIACLMAMPKAKGLFHKAISQSGAADKARPLSEGLKHSEAFLYYLALKPEDIQKLKALTEKELLSAQQKMESHSKALTVTTPIVDKNILPISPLKAVQSGSSTSIPILAGTNQDEWRLFTPKLPNFHKMDTSELISRCSELVPSTRVQRLIEAYRAAREKQNLTANPFDLFIAIKSDHEFRIPTLQLAEAQMRNNPAVYCYLFNWKSPFMNGAFGSCHSLEIGFVLGTYKSNRDFYGSGPLADRLSNAMQDTWAAFAKTGNPCCENHVNWPAYGSQRNTQVLGEDLHIVESPFDEERRIWDSIPEAFNQD
jgi:para-nitrobenzyl esterase